MYLLSFSLKRGVPFQFISSFLHYWKSAAFDTQWIFPRINTWKSRLASMPHSRYRYNSERVAVCTTSWGWHNNSIFIGFCWRSVGWRLAGAGPGGTIDIEYEAPAAASCPEHQAAVSSQQSVPGGSVTRSTESRVTSRAWNEGPSEGS